MSKAKAPQYSANEPAFLQRLRNQHVNTDGRHERPTPRLKRAKVDDEEDLPAYVLEDGHETLSKAEYEKLVSSESTKNDKDDPVPTVVGQRGGDTTDEAGGRKQKPQQGEASIGQKKRKAATVVEQLQGPEEGQHDKDVLAKTTKKFKKKGKPIKLSFDDG